MSETLMVTYQNKKNKKNDGTTFKSFNLFLISLLQLILNVFEKFSIFFHQIIIYCNLFFFFLSGFVYLYCNLFRINKIKNKEKHFICYFKQEKLCNINDFIILKH